MREKRFIRLSILTSTRIAWAALLLVAPDLVMRALDGPPPDRRWRIVARVLGLRHLAEAWFERSGRPSRLSGAALVDTLHALSVVGYATLDPLHRRASLADASVAGCFAVYGWRLAATHPASRSPVSRVMEAV